MGQLARGTVEHVPEIRSRQIRGIPNRVGDPQALMPLTIAVWPEDNQWVSEVVEFDIASCGDSADEATDQAVDAVLSYLNTLEDLGERDQALARRSVPVYYGPPDTLPMAGLPRDVYERAGLQIRTVSLPLSEQSHGH